MKIDKNGHIYIPCEICGKDERHGPHLYNGHHLRLYGGIFCCDSCWDNNWDGWTHSLEPKQASILNPISTDDITKQNRIAESGNGFPSGLRIRKIEKNG